MQLTIFIFRIVAAFLTPASDEVAEGLHRFAPYEVSVEHAREHAWAAGVAAAVYDDYDGLVRHVDVDLILALDWHESRFTSNAVGLEHDGLVSCGALTPMPVDHCEKKPLLTQILDGTQHLVVDWGTARDVRSEREAFLGYAGGYLGIRNCRQGPVLRYKTHGDDLCQTPEVFAQIRDRIRETRRKGTSS